MDSKNKTEKSISAISNGEFVTKDMDLCIILWARDHRLVFPNGAHKEEDTGEIFFTFPIIGDLNELVRDYDAGREIPVDLTKAWAAAMLFKSNLYDPLRDQHVVISLRTIGHTVEISETHRNFSRFKVDGDDAKADMMRYLGNHPFTVNARTFCLERRKFAKEVNKNRYKKNSADY